MTPKCLTVQFSGVALSTARSVGWPDAAGWEGTGITRGYTRISPVGLLLLPQEGWALFACFVAFVCLAMAKQQLPQAQPQSALFFLLPFSLLPSPPSSPSLLCACVITQHDSAHWHCTIVGNNWDVQLAAPAQRLEQEKNNNNNNKNNNNHPRVVDTCSVCVCVLSRCACD